MGKELTIKALANKMKAKGLQKLRWYCEMCQKQCRDENGFKCHCLSESHQRQMAIFAENPNKVMDDYTKEFEKSFLDLLSRRFGCRRVSAGVVYNEYIADKGHTHMNSTIFETLTTFVKYLGRTGKCVIDETEKGWYIQYIDRDPAVLARQEALDRSKKRDLDDQQRHERQLDKLVKAAKESGAGAAVEYTGLERGEGDVEPVAFSFTGVAKKKSGAAGGAGGAPVAVAVASVFGDDDDELRRLMRAAPTKAFKVPEFMMHSAPAPGKRGRDDDSVPAAAAASATATAPTSATAASGDVVAEGAAAETGAGAGAGVSSWLWKGLVVKIMNQRVGGGKYYEAKGTIIKVESMFVAIVRITGTKEALRIDQNDLETVIPALGGRVCVLCGAHKWATAALESVSPETYTVGVRLPAEAGCGLLSGLEYEQVCKVDEEFLAKHSEGDAKKRPKKD